MEDKKTRKTSTTIHPRNLQNLNLMDGGKKVTISRNIDLNGTDTVCVKIKSMEESSTENNTAQNKHGGCYVNGKEFSTEKKVECEETYRRLCAENDGPPSIRAFAKEAKVSRSFAKKMMEEIESNGHAVSVASLKKKRQEDNSHLRGVGARKLSPHEKQILIDLRHDDPSRSNMGYVTMLHQITGTQVSKSLIHNFFKEIGPCEGKLRKLPMIPIDKYRPKNIKTYQVSHHRIPEIRKEKPATKNSTGKSHKSCSPPPTMMQVQSPKKSSEWEALAFAQISEVLAGMRNIPPGSPSQRKGKRKASCDDSVVHSENSGGNITTNTENSDNDISSDSADCQSQTPRERNNCELSVPKQIRRIARKMDESAYAPKRKGPSSTAVTKQFQARIGKLKEQLRTSKADHKTDQTAHNRTVKSLNKRIVNLEREKEADTAKLFKLQEARKADKVEIASLTRQISQLNKKVCKSIDIQIFQGHLSRIKNDLKGAQKGLIAMEKENQR